MPRSKPQQVPLCNYGASCNRKGCVYRHPAKSNTEKKNEKCVICVHFVSGSCSFGSKCANRHPGKEEAQKFREQCARIECRFGAKCENGACLYRHDGRGQVSLVVPGPPSKKKVQQDMWWKRELDEDVCDPISLEPLCELSYPPFELGGHFFDGVVLATYVVSTSSFVNPMTREVMTRQQCRALDEYLEENALVFGSKSPRVNEAFDLYHRQKGDTSLQREATTLLHSLFGFERYQNNQDETSADSIEADDPVVRTQGQTLVAAWEEYDQELPSQHHEEDIDHSTSKNFIPEEDAFPSLSTHKGSDLSARAPEWQAKNTFAEAAAKKPDAAAAAAQSLTRASKYHTNNKKRAAVKIPADAWISFRDARIFGIRDPFERYAAVAALQTRPDVIDLHFQSTRTAPNVLDHVLEEALKARGQLWLITGTGHHVPTGTHQLSHGVLHATVLSYLEENHYDFAIAKDNAGHAGAFLIYGRLFTKTKDVLPLTTHHLSPPLISQGFLHEDTSNNYSPLLDAHGHNPLEASSFLLPPSAEHLGDYILPSSQSHSAWQSATRDDSSYYEAHPDLDGRQSFVQTQHNFRSTATAVAVAPPNSSKKSSSSPSSSCASSTTASYSVFGGVNGGIISSTTFGLPSPPTGGRHF